MQDDIWVIGTSTTVVFDNYYTSEEKAIEVLNDLANRFVSEGGVYNDGIVLQSEKSEFEDPGYHKLIIKRPPGVPNVYLTATRLSKGD